MTPSMDRDEISGKAYDLEIARRLWQHVRPYRRPFYGSLVCLALSSVALLTQPYLLKVAIDRYVAAKDLGGLSAMAVLFIVAVVAELVFYYGQYYLTMIVAQQALSDLRVEVFAHLQKLPMAYFDRNPVGRLVTRMTTDVDVLNEMFAAGALTIAMDALTLLGIVAILFHMHAGLALVTLACLPFMAIAINFFRVRARHSYRQIRERIARINAYLQEAISGMAVIQLFVREARSYREFERLNDSHRASNHLSNVYEAMLFSLVEAASSITVALTIWYASGRILEGAIAFGTLVAFVEYIQKFFIPIRDFSQKYAVMQSAMASAERIFLLLDTPVDIENSKNAVVPKPFRGEVVFDNVWFHYKAGDPVLKGVSFRIAPGEKIAVVGATGSGKTTTIKLLNRSYDIQKGSVKVSGVDVREWDLKALRRHIGVVLQDVFLFSGDVRGNLALGDPSVTQARIEQAARHANAESFIRQLPDGYQASVRERGSNFSGGQRQLLSLARVLVFQPEILVMDEATSSVDTETEALIQDALEKVMRGRTCLMIAHRLSTIRNADRIIVLHHGEVREIGSHAELMEKHGIYHRLYQLQYEREELKLAPPASLAKVDA